MIADIATSIQPPADRDTIAIKDAGLVRNSEARATVPNIVAVAAATADLAGDAPHATRPVVILVPLAKG